MTKRHWIGGPCVVAAVALAGGTLLSGCSNSKSGASTADLAINVTEFKLAAATTSVPAGKIKLTVANDGKVQHEVVAFKSDLAEDAFPTTADGNRVNEDGAGITHIDPEAEDVNPGKTKTVTLDLKPGRYVFLCNLPLHYKQGMHTVINVT